MLLPRILAPVRASLAASCTLAAPTCHVLAALRTPNAAAAPTTLTFARHASHQSQGRANGAKDGPGKRLGAKKSGGEFVIPGNIIFRQRGTAWFPGENCKFGRDHCIFAMESGYVRYYKDPGLHPKRQYIGVALEKDHSLPYPVNGARRRRLNMVAGPADQPILLGEGADAAPAEEAVVVAPVAPGRAGGRILTMGHGYAYREANWQIGRAAERAGVQVKPFVPGDRWAAWRKSQARIQANEEKKRMRSSSKKGGSKKAGKKAR